MSIPWDEPAVLEMYVNGLPSQKVEHIGRLADVVEFAVKYDSRRGDGHIVKLQDGSRTWEGPEIYGLAKILLGGAAASEA